MVFVERLPLITARPTGPIKSIAILHPENLFAAIKAVLDWPKAIPSFTRSSEASHWNTLPFDDRLNFKYKIDHNAIMATTTR